MTIAKHGAYHLAKKLRSGTPSPTILNKTEKAALLIVCDTCSMKGRFCGKSLSTMHQEYERPKSLIKYGLHGRPRKDGSLYYPGLLARGIVYIIRSGKGIPTLYGVNEKLLRIFVNGAETLDEFKLQIASWDNLEDILQATKEFKEWTESQTKPLSEPQTKPQIPFQDRENDPSDTEPQTRGHQATNGLNCGSKVLIGQKEGLCSLLLGALDEAAATESGVEVAMPRSAVQDDPQTITTVKPAPAALAVDNEHRKNLESTGVASSRWMSEHRTPSEIIAEYRRVFKEMQAYLDVDVVERDRPYRGMDWYTIHEHLTGDELFKSSKRHRAAAVKLYRDWGHDYTMNQWAKFLGTEDHRTTTANNAPPRTWLLNDFVKWVKIEQKVQAVALQG